MATERATKPYLPVRQYTLAVTFHADAVTVMEIKQAMEDAANALIRPTKDLASAVFTRGAEAVVRAAQEDAAAVDYAEKENLDG